MKKLFAVLFLLFAAICANAQTTTTITGQIKDLSGAVVTSGQVVFTPIPVQSATISGTARFTATPITCSIINTGAVKALDGVSNCTLMTTTATSPTQGYKACIQPQFADEGNCFNIAAIGTSIDISTVVFTPASVPFNSAFVDTFTDQTIGGNKTFTGNVTHNGHDDTGIGNVGAVTGTFSGAVSTGAITASGNINAGSNSLTAGAGTFTGLNSSGGALNGTVGATTPSTGGFTDVTSNTVTNGSPNSTVASAAGATYPLISYRNTTESGQPNSYTPILALNWQNSGGTNSGGKTKPYGIQVVGYFQSTGEHAAIATTTNASGSGDEVGIHSIVYCGGLNDDSGGEGCMGGRFDADQRGQSSSTVFTATLSTATNNGNGTFNLAYPSNTTADLNGRGVNRWIIRTDGGTYTTGTISSFSGTGTITAVGSGTTWATTFGSGAHTDLCLAVTADTTEGFKFVVPITSVTDDTHLVLTYQVNAVNEAWPSSNTGAYTIYRCSQISSVSTLSQMTVTNGYTGWAATQTVEVPLGYNGHILPVHIVGSQVLPWSSNFPVSMVAFDGDASGQAMRGFSFVSGKLSRAFSFSNNWGAAPDGSDAGGTAFDYTTNPARATLSRDTTNCVNIWQEPNSGATQNLYWKYCPSSGLFSVGTTGSGDKITFDGVTGKVANGSTPTASCAIGTGCTVSVSLGSNNMAGQLVLTIGTSPANPSSVTINFNGTFGVNATVCSFSYGNGSGAWTAPVTPIASTASTTQYVVSITNGAAYTASTTLGLKYQCSAY